MGRVLRQLELLDQVLQGRSPHPILGTASLHASLIDGGRELSSYPDHCRLQMERRTIPGEDGDTALSEVEAILARLRADDPGFEASGRLTFARPPYELSADHQLPQCLGAALAAAGGPAELVGMSFWTDAAVLGTAGIPSVLFGPGGAGLHSTEEYVRLADVAICRDVLATLAFDWCQA
jgi:acetylornithine deacetylase